jgi:hypothetical protein
MENDNKGQVQSGPDKNQPQNISGKNEAQTKERTEPLQADKLGWKDYQEGDMNNGELGAGLRKEQP